jgi:probable addiction module antidote protein
VLREGIEIVTLKTTRWDVTEFLASDAAMAAYLDAVFEVGDPDEMRDALRHVARARGMAELAKAAGITRAGLYKALGEDGNPSFATIVAVMKALGMTLTAKPA